jgi:ppGpp synthetase/RelA/SpoT-type nucleotidyltranferase
MRYRILAAAIKAARGNRREVMNRLIESIRQGLEKTGIEATVTGREKTIYSVYKKMGEKRYTFSQVFDIYGVRVLVADKARCYEAMGVLHELHKPIPGKFKDYVAIPKANGYQSLHTTLFGPFGTPLEAQIRTHDMHRVAEAGVAAHWLYKSGGAIDLAEAQRETTKWLQSLLEIQSESRDSKEFLEHVKGDLFPEEIYVFTPKGKIMALPRGATAVDFAYGVHTDIGHHCVAARINYELLPLRTELKNGDHVEILTAPTARPEPVVARVRRDRQGALAHPALPEGPAAEGVGGARRAAARAGPHHAQGRPRVDRLGPLGSAREGVRRQEPARHPRRLSASAGGSRSSSRRRSRAWAPKGEAEMTPGAGEGRGAHAARRRGRRDHVREVLPARSPATRSSRSSARARA